MKLSDTTPFARGQKTIRILLALAVVLGLAGFLLFPQQSMQQTVCILGSLACLIGIPVVAKRDCRCPHCSKAVFGGVLVIRVCPNCKRDLYSGGKVKKSKAKKS